MLMIESIDDRLNGELYIVEVLDHLRFRVEFTLARDGKNPRVTMKAPALSRMIRDLVRRLEGKTFTYEHDRAPC
jgi:hypothetical protein